MTTSFLSPLIYARTSSSHQIKVPSLKKRSRLSHKSHYVLKKREERRFMQVNNSRKVRFCPFVSVSSIPNRLEYTEFERESMWTSEEDQFRDRQRNAVEFAYENGDWQQVKEEKDFVLIRGEWIHPVHVSNAFRRLQIRLERNGFSKQMI